MCSPKISAFLQQALTTCPPSDRYIFNLPIPGNLDSDKIAGATAVPNGFVHRMGSQVPIKTSGGTVRITDSKNFPVSKTIAAALVEVEPGGMRELHWHPNTDEWQYYIQGIGRMGVFAANGHSRTFDFAAGDVGLCCLGTGAFLHRIRIRSLFPPDRNLGCHECAARNLARAAGRDPARGAILE